MRCPECKWEDTKVLDSRMSLDGKSIRRRRKCTECEHRFTTYEREEDIQIQVRKKSGIFEPFSRDKLRAALSEAFKKRPFSPQELEGLLSKVEQTIADTDLRAVDSSLIGDVVMEKLKAADHVAYVRFASVYKDFRDPEEFKQALDSLDM